MKPTEGAKTFGAQGTLRWRQQTSAGLWPAQTAFTLDALSDLGGRSHYAGESPQPVALDRGAASSQGCLRGLKPSTALLPPLRGRPNVRAILDTLSTKAPDAKTLLLAIFPRGEAIKRQRNDEVNRQIEKLADNQKVFWLDLSQHFLEPDGALSKPLFKDEKPFPIHLSDEGYEAWAKALRPKVDEMIRK